MNRSEITSKLFGLKQEEMAMLLGVSRAQLSMYESERRRLPAAAMSALEEMRKYVEVAKTVKRLPSAKKMDDKTQTHLAELLKEVQYQIATVERKIAKLKAQLEADERRLQLADFLAGNQNKGGRTADMRRFVQRKFTKNAEKNQSDLLLELEIRLEVLGFEEGLIQGRLKESA